jgi:hypothetical protein
MEVISSTLTPLTPLKLLTFTLAPRPPLFTPGALEDEVVVDAAEATAEATAAVVSYCMVETAVLGDDMLLLPLSGKIEVVFEVVFEVVVLIPWYCWCNNNRRIAGDLAASTVRCADRAT